MRLIYLALLCFSFAHAKHCTFKPPAGWEIAQPKNGSAHVKIGFIGKGSKDFRPSMNFATEEVDVPLKEYVKAVKELQLSDPTTKWRDLGKLTMRAGKGKLVEVTKPSPFGDIKVLQAIFVEDDMAYILTAVSLKEDLPKFQAELLKTFQSLELAEDLPSLISDETLRAEFETLLSSLGQKEAQEEEWKRLQAEIENFAQMGPYWQFLALQEGRAKIYPPKGEKK